MTLMTMKDLCAPQEYLYYEASIETRRNSGNRVSRVLPVVVSHLSRLDSSSVKPRDEIPSNFCIVSLWIARRVAPPLFLSVCPVVVY